MSTFKKIALTLLAAALPCLGWAAEASWTTVTLPDAKNATEFLKNIGAGANPGSATGALAVLEAQKGTAHGSVLPGTNGDNQYCTIGGDAEGEEGYWSGSSITLMGRSGVSGMSAVIVPAKGLITDGTKIKQLRVTATIRGTYNDGASNTVYGQCGIAIGHATYDTESSAYTYTETASAQGSGGGGADTDTTIVATIDYPYADVITWDESSENADKIVLSVATQNSGGSDTVRIVQIDKVEYLTLENYEAANMPVPNAVQLINFGLEETDTTDEWLNHTQAAGGTIVPMDESSTSVVVTIKKYGADGNEITGNSASTNGNFSSSITAEGCTAFPTEGGAYVALDGTSYKSVLAEMKHTLGLSADIPDTCYKNGLVNGGVVGHTAIVKNLDPSRTYVMYHVGGGIRSGATSQPIGGFQLLSDYYSGNPRVDYALSTGTSYTSHSTITNAINPNSGVYIVVRVSNIKPTANGEIRFNLTSGTSGRAGINAFAIAEMDRVLNDAAETWVNEDKWTTPTATSNPILTVNNNVTLTAEDAAATAGTLTINNAVGKDYELTFAGTSLTTTTLNVNANTDVSGITASLGDVTVAEGKTLSIGANTTVSIAPGTNGNVGANAGTIRVVGGTANDPIELSAGTAAHHYIGAVNVAENSVLKLHATGGNKTYNITGNGETSHVILTSGQDWGVSNNNNSKISNCTLEIPQYVTGETANANFWLTPSKIGDNVHLVIGTGREITLENETTTLSLASLSGAGKFHDSNGSTATFKITDGADKTFSGTIKKNHSVVKEGTGTQIFSGANTYSGTTTISGGTLQVAGGSLGTGAITVNANLTYTANATPANTFTGTDTITADACTLDLSGADVDDFTGSYSIVNNGTLILPAGAEGTKDGETITQKVTITNGTLKIQLTEQQVAMGYTANMTTGSVTFLDASGNAISTDYVDGYTYTSPIPTWTPTAGNQTWSDTSLWAHLTGGVVPTEGSVVINTSELTTALDVAELSAGFTSIIVNGNTTAATTITAFAPTAAATITINGMVKLPISVINDANVTLAYGTDAILIADVATDADLTKAISGNCAFWKDGTGTLTLNANVYPTNGTKVLAGTLKFGSSWIGNGQNDTKDDVTVCGGAFLDFGGKAAGYTRYVTLEADATLKNTGGGIGTDQRQLKGVILDGDATIENSGNFGLIASQWGTTILTLDGHTLTKKGTGAFWLCNTTIDDGTINIEEGRFAFENDKPSTVGNIVLNVAEGASWNRTAGTVSYTGSITKQGTGSVTIDSSISSDKAITVNAGELVLTGANGNYSGTITVDNGATLKTTGPNASPFGTTNEIVNNGSVIVASDANATPSITKLSGSGSLTVNSGIVTLATSTYSGATVINDGATLKSTGKLDYGNSAGVTNLEGSAITINANGTLVVGNEVWRKIKGTGKLHVTDSATVIIGRSSEALSGLTDEFTGTVQIDSGATAEFRNWHNSGYAIADGNFIVNGTLNLTAGYNKVAATLTIANGKTLSGTGTINAPVTLAAGATIDASAGALNLAGGVTQSGALTIKVASTATADTPVLTCNTSTINTANITLVNAEGVEIDTLEVKANNNGTALVLVKVVSGAMSVDSVPAAISLDESFASYGYGTHTVLTLTSGTTDWSGMTVTGLPEGATVVTTDTTWGFTVNTLVIYPVGDSITYGRVRRGTAGGGNNDTDVPGGYRLPLYERLKKAGFTTKYVGDHTANATTLLTADGQTYHSGHSGWKVDDGNSIYDNVTGWSENIKTQAGRDPDVILLLLGVNDLSGDQEEPTATAEQMKALIWRLAGIGDKPAGEKLEAALYPNVRIVLAKVLDSTYSGTNLSSGAVLSEHIDEYNTLLETYVTTTLTDDQGADRISIIDLKTPADDVHMRYDYLHPAEEGYEQMARNWFAELDRIYDPTGEATMTAVSRVNTEIELFLPVTATDAAKDPTKYTFGNGSATVVAATVANDNRTVTLTVEGFEPGEQDMLMYTPETLPVGYATVTAGPAATASAELDNLYLVAEWTGFSDGALPTTAGLEAQRGASVYAGRPWLLKAMSSEGTLSATDGALNLGGVALQITKNADSAYISYGRPELTVIIETEGDETGDGLLVARYNYGTGDDVLVRHVRAANGVTIYDHSDNNVALTGTIKSDTTNTYAFSTPYNAAARTAINGTYTRAEAVKYAPVASANWGLVDFIIGAADYAAPVAADYKIRRISVYEGNIDATTFLQRIPVGTGDGEYATLSAAKTGLGLTDVSSIALNYVEEGATFTLDTEDEIGDVAVFGLNGTLTASSAKTIGALSAASGQTITLAETVTITDFAGEGTIAGAGTIQTTNALPTNSNGLTADTWTGKVVLTGTITLANNAKSFEAYGNANSDLEIATDCTCTGYLKGYTGECTVPLALNGTLTINNGYSTYYYIFNELTGSGTFTHDKNTDYTIKFLNANAFTGSLTVDQAQAKIAIGEATPEAGKIAVAGTQTIGATLTATNGITIESSAVVSGTGTLASATTIASGATIDASTTQLTAKAAVTFPTDALTVKVAELPEEGTTTTILKQTGLEAAELSVAELTVKDGETTATEGYQLIANDTGYAIEPVFVFDGDFEAATKEALVNAIAAITEAKANATITLTTDITVDDTLVIDAGEGNTVTIELNDHMILSDAPVIRIQSGKLKLVPGTNGTGTVMASNTTAIVVGADNNDGTTVANEACALEIGAGVNVSTYAAIAVNLVKGSISGAGFIYGGLNLENGTTIDATKGHLTITGGAATARIHFPEPVSDGTGGTTKSTVTFLMPDGLVYPQEIIKCTSASMKHAENVTICVNDFQHYNYGLTVMVDNKTGDIAAYGLLQYVCTSDDRNYTSVKEAIAAGEKDIFLSANTTEDIVLPEGVTLQLMSSATFAQYKVIGNVTVESGATLEPLGGDIEGNLILEDGATLSVYMEVSDEATYDFHVSGTVTFPTGELTIIAEDEGTSVDLGVPKQIISSGVALTPGATLEGTTVNVVSAAGQAASEVVKIISTSYTYEIVSTLSGACTLDGVEYETIQQALAAYTATGDATLKLKTTPQLSETLVIDVDDPATDEIEEITIDLNGLALAAELENGAPTIRIESGDVWLISTAADNTYTQVSSINATAIVVGADENGDATEKAALHIDDSVQVLGTTDNYYAVDMVSGTLSGDATLTGNLNLRDGVTIDASAGALTMGSYYGLVQYNVTFPGTEDTAGTITVIPPVGATQAIFIHCAGADAGNHANTNVQVVLTETAVSVDYEIIETYETVDEVSLPTGYAVWVGEYAAATITSEGIEYHATFAAAVVAAGETGMIILMSDLTLEMDVTADIYTNGFDITTEGARAIDGKLILTDGTILDCSSGLTATEIEVADYAEVTASGSLTSTTGITVNGTLNGQGEITGPITLNDGAELGGFIGIAGTVTVSEGATVTIDATVNTNLTLNNATVNGTGTIEIGEGKTLAGAGTINTIVILDNGATVDTCGYESNFLVLTKLTALTEDILITVKADTLSNVINAGTAAIAMSNFTLTLADGSTYEAYNPGTPQALDTDAELLIPVVATRNGENLLGVVKLNYYIGGMQIADPTQGDAGVGVAKQLAAYGYRNGVLEIKGVDTASSDPVEGYQLFTNVVNGFVGDYLVITWDFGVKNITVLPGTVGGVTANYIVVTADVDGINDKTEGDLSGNADYREGTRVELLDGEGNAVAGATGLDVAGAKALGLVDAGAETLPAGVKYFAVKLPAGPTASSETLKFSVKATNE